MEKAIVRAATLVVFLLASYGLGAPVSKVQELDKRRESTPEILNLEQQLKKAAGEDKQYFSATEARPMPQIDGLATDEQDNASPVDEEYGLLDDVIEPSPEGDGQLPDRIKTYDQLWDIVKQHPEYMRTILHDYLGNTDQLDRIGPADYEIPKRDASDELSYPSDGRLEPAMDDVYRGSDDDDRADSLIADYMVPPAQQQFGRADGRMEEQDEETNMDNLDEGEEDGEDEDGEGEDGDDDDEEDEEQDDEEEEDEDDKLDEDVDDDEEEDDEDEEDEDQSDDEEEEEEDDEEEEDEDEENVKERKSNSVEDENDDDDDDDDEEDDEEDEQEDGNEADDEEDEADEEEEDDDEEGEEDELDSLNSKQAKEESKGDIKAVSAAVNEMEEAVNEGKAKPSASQKHEPYKMWQNIGDVVVPPMM